MTVDAGFAAYVVKLYLDSPALNEQDDPISDAGRLAQVAEEMAKAEPGAPTRIQQKTSPIAQDGNGKITLELLLSAVSEHLHYINPSISVEVWRDIYEEILCRRYGGTWVRLRKRPKRDKLLDADALTLAEWQNKYDGSRAYYYRLKKEALRMRQEEVRKRFR